MRARTLISSAVATPMMPPPVSVLLARRGLRLSLASGRGCRRGALRRGRALLLCHSGARRERERRNQNLGLPGLHAVPPMGHTAARLILPDYRKEVALRGRFSFPLISKFSTVPVGVTVKRAFAGLVRSNGVSFLKRQRAMRLAHRPFSWIP